jgi:hypothetical protein
MLSRDEKGKLILKQLVLTVITDDLFEECNDIREITWLTEELKDDIARAALERIEQVDWSME